MRFLKVLSLSILMSFVSGSINAETSFGKDDFDWRPVMDAIMMVESRGNTKARNGQFAGILQISPILVRECNNILRGRGSKKRYSLTDRFDADKSREMFVIIQSFHNPLNSVERAIRLWNGGLAYTIKSTQRYFERVMKHMP